jgi:hypothetical protein
MGSFLRPASTKWLIHCQIRNPGLAAQVSQLVYLTGGREDICCYCGDDPERIEVCTYEVFAGLLTENDVALINICSECILIREEMGDKYLRKYTGGFDE